MNKENINWKEIAEYLLWCHYLDEPHGNSGYYMVDIPIDERGLYKGSIHKGLCFASYIHPSQYHQLTWKDLMFELNVHKDHLYDDTHDCTKCPDEKKCKAFFKYNKEQQQCSWWQDNVDSTLEFHPDWNGLSEFQIMLKKENEENN